MTGRRARGLTWTLVVLTVLLLLFRVVVLSVTELKWPLTLAFSWAIALVFLAVGALIVTRHPGNAIGWIFLFVALSIGLGETAHGYAEYWLSEGGAEALGKAAALYADVSWVPFILIPATFLLLLFPDGRLLSRRWRPIAWCAAVGIGGVLVTTGLVPGPLQDFPQVTNPLGWRGALLDPLTGAAFLLVLLGVAGSSLSLILRFRRARGERRLQMKWLAFGGAVAAVTVPIAVLGYDVWGETVSNLAIMLSILGLPIAAGIAILRYRLYDIDVLVNRALVYGALTALLGFFYFGTVVVLQRVLEPLTAESDLAIAGSTLAVAAAFRPLRARVQDFIDRRFYRRKYDAAATLETFTSTLRNEVDLESLTGELVSVVGSTMQPAHASVWLRRAEEASIG